MSRRGGVAVPLITLIGSFGLVLALGGWLGTSTSTSTRTSTAPANPEPRGVRIVLDGLSGRTGKLQPLPGLRVTISPAAPGTTKDPESGGDSSGSTETVEICVSPTRGWTVTGDGWTEVAAQDGENAFCRDVIRNAGKLDPIEILLDQR